MIDDTLIKVLIGLVGLAVVPLLQHVIAPLFVEKFKERTKLYPVYRGVIHWPSTEDHEMELSVKKTGYKISGEITFLSGRHRGKRYKLTGSYNHGLLNFIYEPSDDKSTSRGTGLFQRKQDGHLLTGIFSYFSESRDVIASAACEFRPYGHEIPPAPSSTSPIGFHPVALENKTGRNAARSDS